MLIVIIAPLSPPTSREWNLFCISLWQRPRRCVIVYLSREGWITCRKWKEEIFIAKKTCSSKNLAVPRFSQQYPDELKVLIQEVQQNNQEAIDALCKRFELLIYKEARRSNIYNALGEDAVNIAWTIFLGFVLRYNGADFVHLPSLIQYHLYYELEHCAKRRGRVWDYEVLDLAHHESDANTSYDPLQNLLLNMALEQELKKLTPRQLEILWRYYFAGESHETIAKAMHCATRTVGYQRMLAIKQLQKKIT